MVTRCVCFERTFRELREIALRTGSNSLEELQEHVAFGKKCGLCRPYVRLMLLTGKTAFEIIPPTES